MIYPSDKLIENAKILETVFNDFHKDFLSDENKIFFKVADTVYKLIKQESRIPWDALMCLVKTRTYIRLKLLNQQRKDANERIRLAKLSAQKQKFYT